MFSPQIILHPTDFSEASALALRIAADLAAKYGARLIVLHVVETLGPENVTFGEVATQLEPSGYRHRLEADLRQLHPPSADGVQIDYMVAEGEPASGIMRVAAEQHCDLIVMGTHGRRGLPRLLMGSVAEIVLRKSACPVLIAKAPGKPA